jgi:quinol monooxygenase YgiN
MTGYPGKTGRARKSINNSGFPRESRIRMILVDARCTILPERQGDFVRVAQEVIALVQRETGCIRYELAADVCGSGIFHFIEEWESQELLDEHLVQSHMQDYFAKTAPWHAAPTRLTLYEILSSRSITMND